MDNARAESLFGPAARAALASWDVEPTGLTLASVSENVVFRVDTTTRPYVLRLHRPGYHTLDELIAEQRWTAALNEAGVAAPLPVASRNGDGYVAVAVDEAGETRFAGLAHWQDGGPLRPMLRKLDEATRLKYYERLGSVAARIHNQASTWSLPSGFRRHSLDAAGFMGERPFWGRFWEHPDLSGRERAHLGRLRGRLFDVLSGARRDAANFSLIHADLHAGNVLVDGDDLSVIDFDDAGFGWHAYEFAVAVAGQEPAAVETNLDAMIRGYRRERSLDEATVATIPMFLLVRALATIGWLMQRPEHGSAEAIRALLDEALGSADGVLRNHGLRPG